jgi:hypothetical protein
MNPVDKDFLLHRLDEARKNMEDLVQGSDPEKEIYPGWTIKDMLAHITGWDEVLIDALRAHGLGLPPSVPSIHSLDKYNEFTVSSREKLTCDQILKEFRLKRQELHEIIEQLPKGKFLEPVIIPWGKETSVNKLVDIFYYHEKEHAHDIKEWLKHPEKPLGKAGK